MTRYSATPDDLTVRDLIEQLEMLVRLGYGDATPEIFEPDAEQWMPITGFTYGPDQPLKFYADEP